MASIMNGNSIIRSTACSCALWKKHQSSALLALCQGNHWWIPHKGPLMQKMGSWHDVIMYMNYMFFPYRTETVWWQAAGRARTTHSTKSRCHASVLRQSSATYRPQPARETAASVGYTWPLQRGRHAPALSNRCFKLVQTSSGHHVQHRDIPPTTRAQAIVQVCNNNVIQWNIFCVIGLLWWESLSHRWIPITTASVAELWCFFDIRLNNNRSAGGLGRHVIHCDVTVMWGVFFHKLCK